VCLSYTQVITLRASVVRSTVSELIADLEHITNTTLAGSGDSNPLLPRSEFQVLRIRHTFWPCHHPPLCDSNILTTQQQCQEQAAGATGAGADTNTNSVPSSLLSSASSFSVDPHTLLHLLHYGTVSLTVQFKACIIGEIDLSLRSTYDLRYNDSRRGMHISTRYRQASHAKQQLPSSAPPPSLSSLPKKQHPVQRVLEVLTPLGWKWNGDPSQSKAQAQTLPQSPSQPRPLSHNSCVQAKTALFQVLVCRCP
jgi:hypothetical protein